MTVETTLAREQYATNGTTGPWSVRFYFLEDDHLQVIYTDEDGAEATLTLNADYTVTGAGDENGGTVTTTTAYASGGYITILRNVEPLQEVDLIDGDSLPAETLETAFDKLTMLAQQALEVTDRALVFAPSDTAGSTLPAAAARASKLLGFDSDGVLSLTAPASGSAAELAIDIADSDVQTKGAGQVGYGTGLSYAANTVGSSLNDLHINVRDYGAVGDGTTNDRAAINLAIADLTHGQWLYFPASSGAYMINDDLSPIPDGAGVRFAPGAWIKRSASSVDIYTMFFYLKGNNVLEGVNIDGNAYPASGGVPGTWTAEPFGIYADTAYPANNVVIRGGQIKNCNYGIFALGVTGWRVQGLQITRNRLSCILMGAATGYPLAHNTIQQCRFEEAGDTAVALVQYASSTVLVTYNSVIGCVAKDTQLRTNGYAFDVEAGTVAGYILHNSFIGNTVEQTTVSSSTQGGLTMGDFSAYGIISGNNVRGNNNTTGDTGINAPKSTYMLIEGNNISRMKGHAINVDGATDVTVRDNKIRDCGGANSTFPAIKIALNNSTTGVTVSGNDLAWSDSYAAVGAGSVAIGASVASGKTVTNIAIRDNVITNAIDIGIRVAGLSGNMATGVQISGNTLWGGGALFTRAPIQATYCDRMQITGNFVKDAKRGFDVENSTNLRFSDNTLHNAISDTLAEYVLMTGVTNGLFTDNDLRATVTTPFNPLSRITGAHGNTARDNVGFKTEGYGVTAAIATGATVSHGLITTPTSVIVTPAETGPTDVTVSAIGATTFTVNFGGGGSKTFSWRAQV